MIRAAAADPRFMLCAAADPLQRPRDAFARDFAARVYDDYRDLCRDAAVEAIYIASPHRLHAEQAVMALSHGKAVLVEKPLALTLAACDAVIEAADGSGLPLIVGHTHAFDPGIRAMRRIVQSGTLGRLGMILALNYTDFLYRAHAGEEFDPERGGGIVLNQLTHQIEIARLLAGGVTRSVRASLGAFESSRPAPGHCTAFLDFKGGAAASLTYSSYDFFDSDEFHHWIAEGGTTKESGRHGRTRRRFAAGDVAEEIAHQDLGYGGRILSVEQPFQPHFGIVIATCEMGDLRLSPNGLLIYDKDGSREVPIARGPVRPGQGDALEALWGALRVGRPSPHTARWGKATLEVALGIQRSATERREVMLCYQVPVPDALAEPMQGAV
jgi:phthalate 4,5-cis-dihydrodiol dehydrogenase